MNRNDLDRLLRILADRRRLRPAHQGRAPRLASGSTACCAPSTTSPTFTARGDPGAGRGDHAAADPRRLRGEARGGLRLQRPRAWVASAPTPSASVRRWPSPCAGCGPTPRRSPISGLPDVVPSPERAPPWARPRHRPDRLGQDHDPGGHGRPHQPPRPCHIITIEDPVEYLHKDDLAAIDQREVGFDTESFTSAMRTILRQDPDVILIGEMRDPETVYTALTAAETGHLVFSTLHTTTATETINRIVDFFPPHQQGQVRVSLSGALTGTDLPAADPARRRQGPRAGARDHGGERPHPAGDPRPRADVRHRRDHGRGRVLRDADLRPVAGRAAARRHDRPARGDERRFQPPRPQGALERLGIVPTGRGFVSAAAS